MAHCKPYGVYLIAVVVACGCSRKANPVPEGMVDRSSGAATSSANEAEDAEAPLVSTPISEDANPSPAAVASEINSEPVIQESEESPAASPNVDPGSPTEATVESPSVTAVESLPLDDKSAELTVRELIEFVDDAVVLITTEDARGRKNSVGSGFVVDRRGLVATNYHVVRRASAAHAQLRDGRRIDVEGVVCFDRGRDLAILQLADPPDDLEVVELVAPKEIRQGDTLIAVGHPHGFKFTVTTGIVSAVRGTDDLPDQFKRFSQWPDDQVWIQTNAAISHGNSGGPLFDQHGRLVGINTWIDPDGENLGFATHVRHLNTLMTDLTTDVQPLPIPGSAASRTLTDPQVLTIHEAFQRELREHLRKKRSIFGLLQSPTHPAKAHIEKLLALAEEHLGSDTDFQALSSACAVARSDSDETKDEMNQILDQLIERHSADPRLDNVVLELQSIREEEIFAFQRKVLASSPHRHVRATACYCLATGLAYSGRRGAVQPQIIHYWEQLQEEFGDDYLEVSTRFSAINLGKTAERSVFRGKHLAPGKTPPNVIGNDHVGEEFALRDYDGQVVLLTFGADWDEDCRDLYEQKREWMEKYADQPFVVLDVSMDAPERLSRLVDDQTTTWRSWADGADGPIAEAWFVSTIPTVFILDRSGAVHTTLISTGEESIEQIGEAIERALAQPVADLPEDLLAAGDTWKYAVATEPYDDSWKLPDFDDSDWREGATPLGFGLYNEATVLSFDPIATEQWTTLLRAEFEFSESATARDLVMSLWCDDGAVVYLNGTEVIRQGLAADASLSDSATHDIDDDGRRTDHYLVDKDLFIEGRNLVAVALHQAARSSDIRFDLSISSNVVDSLLERFGTGDLVQRLDAIQTLGRIGPGALAAKPVLEGLLDDEQMRVRIRALEALLLIDPSWSPPEPAEEPEESGAERKDRQAEKEEKTFRETLNYWLNNASWSLGSAKNNTRTNYERAWRFIRAAYILSPKEGSAVNTKGTIEYRLGRYADSIETLTQSLRLQRDNPFDHAVLAMAHFRLEQVAKARQALSRAKMALRQVEDHNREEAEGFVDEATALIGEDAEEEEGDDANEEGAPFE